MPENRCLDFGVHFHTYHMTVIDPFIINTCETLNSPEPHVRSYEPKSGHPFSPFEISDPFGLRNAVVPIFCQHSDGRMFGVGTAFHFDGFNNFLTAYHVVDFVEKNSDKRPVLFLSMHAVIFGTVCIPPDCFVATSEVKVSRMDADDPMAMLRGESTHLALDVALLIPEKIGSGARMPQTVPVRTSGWVPTFGETVLAIGFPQLDLSEVSHASQSALLTEGMHGAYGRIVAIHTQGVSRSNPTPVFEVESDWPPGMSGRPVFNRSGEVVGIVSRSLRADSGHRGTGYAVYIGVVHDIGLFTANLDKDNPGWRLC